MIPAQTMQSLLKTLLNDLRANDGEPDYNRFRTHAQLEKCYGAFLNLLYNGEDDLSIIVSLVEKDPDCLEASPIRRLQALVDYVQIAYAIYQTGDSVESGLSIH